MASARKGTGRGSTRRGTGKEQVLPTIGITMPRTRAPVGEQETVAKQQTRRGGRSEDTEKAAILEMLERAPNVALPPWSELYDPWRLYCGELAPDLLGEPYFAPVPVVPRHPHLRVRDHVVDFWPRARLAARRADLEALGGHLLPWKPSSGEAHTAELLWAYREDPEDVAAVWIAASGWQLTRRGAFPEAWRGPVLRTLFGYVIAAAANRFSRDRTRAPDRWHHMVGRTLPAQVVDWRMSSICRPERVEDIVRLAVLDAAVSLNSYTLVRVFHATERLRSVEPDSDS